MKTLRYSITVLLVIGAGVAGWRTIRAGRHSQTPPPAQQSGSRSQDVDSQVASTNAPAGESTKQLGPFLIAGQTYTVELQTKKPPPGSPADSGDSVVAMEIHDAAGMLEYRRAFPYVAPTDDDLESWSVSALLLAGTNGTGLLVRYDFYSEPSAPEEEHSGWLQVFGMLNGRLAPFGAPLQVQGGVLKDYVSGDTYRTSRPLGAQADAVEFKVWTGHCRLVFPVRVDWTEGKVSPAQECPKSAGELGVGCQYNVLPEDRRKDGITFVRLWPNPDEKSGEPMKTVVKEDSKVELLTVLVATHWDEGNPAGLPASSKGPMDDAGGFGIASDGTAGQDLWLKVRIDGKEGWMDSEEDFRALGLPEDE
jgi:hypothetical protein